MCSPGRPPVAVRVVGGASAPIGSGLKPLPQSRPHWLLPALLAATCLRSLSPAVAQQPTELKVSAGFQGHVKVGAWAPVRAVVDNTHGSAARGELVIPRQPANPRDEYRVRLDLPPSSRRAFMLYVRYREQTSPLRVELRLQGRRPLVVDAPCSPHAPGARLVLAISRTAGGLSFINAVPLPVPPEAGRSPAGHDAAVAYATPDSATGALGLPDQPVGYSGLSAVVVRDIAPSAFQPGEQDALVKWVQGGGLLAIVAGPNAGELRDSFLEKLGPARLRGQRSVGGLASLAARFREPISAGQALVADIEPTPDAEVLAAERGVPLLVRRHVENGTVYFLTADSSAPPLRDADRLLIALWTELLRDASQARPWAPLDSDSDRAEGGLAADTVRLPVIEWDAFAVFGGFLLAYIIFLVPVNRFILHRADRREWTGWAVLLFIVLFSGGALYLGRGAPLGSSRVYEAAVVRARSGASVGWIDGVVGLRSPNERRYAITAPNTGRSLECLMASRRVPPPWVDEENGFSVPDAAVDLWGFGAFRVEGPLDLGGHVTAQLAASDGHNLAVLVENHTPYPLSRPFVLTSTTAHPLEDLPPEGAPGSVRQCGPIAPNELQSSGVTNMGTASAVLFKHCDTADKRGASAGQRIRNRILTQLAGTNQSPGPGYFGRPRPTTSARPSEAPPPPPRPVFGAWIKPSGPLAGVAPAPGARVSEVLLLVEIPVDPSLIPPAPIMPPPPPMSVMPNPMGGGGFNNRTTQTLQIRSGTRELSLQATSRGNRSVSRLEVSVNSDQPGLTAEIKDLRTGGWHPLNVGVNRAVVTVLPSASNYISAPTGATRIRFSRTSPRDTRVTITVSARSGPP